MEKLFIFFSRLIEAGPALALTGSLVWGMLSVVLSPCHLAAIPLLIGYISGQKEMTGIRAFWTSLSFSLGLLTVIALLGVITSALGRLAGDIGPWGNYLVAGIFFLAGLHLLGLIPLPIFTPGVKIERRGYGPAFWLGLLFGLALGPCTFAYLAPVLAVSFQAAGQSPLYGVLLLSAYGVGHCAVITAAGTFTEVVEKYLQWNENSPGLKITRMICGLLVIAGGVYLVIHAL